MCQGVWVCETEMLQMEHEHGEWKMVLNCSEFFLPFSSWVKFGQKSQKSATFFFENFVPEKLSKRKFKDRRQLRQSSINVDRIRFGDQFSRRRLYFRYWIAWSFTPSQLLDECKLRIDTPVTELHYFLGGKHSSKNLLIFNSFRGQMSILFCCYGDF